MPDLNLDRLLETCVHRHATDMLLLPHTPPQIRLTDSWRTLAIPAVTPADVTSLCQQIFTSPPEHHGDGYAYRDFWYRDVGVFRAMAFGYPNPTALILTPTPAAAAPPPEPPSPTRI